MGTTVTSESIELFRRSLSGRGRETNTHRGYRSDCRIFLAWYGGGEILPSGEATIDLEAVELPGEDFQYQAAMWLNHRKKVEKSINTWARRITSIKSFARWLNREYGIPIFDILEYRGPKPAKGIPHPLKEGISGVLRALDACATDKERAQVALEGLCGARVEEARTVKLIHFNWEEMIVELGGKHGHYRKVPISKRASRYILPAFIAALSAGEECVVGIPDRTARDVIKRVSRRAGLSGDPSSHDYRATFGSWVYDRTKDLALVQELLGHEDPKTTTVYVDIEMKSKRSAVELDEEGFPTDGED